MIELDELKAGDILFLRQGKKNFVHVMICTQATGNFETTKIAHVLGKMEPYALVETHLMHKERLEKNGMHYHVMRPMPHLRIALVLEILNDWLKNLILYDQKQYENCMAQATGAGILDVTAGPDGSDEMETLSWFNADLQRQRDFFKENKYGLITLAATRHVGPTPPVPISEDQINEGILCTSVPIMLFQIASIEKHVGTVSDFWVSDKNVANEELLFILDRDNPVHDEYFSYIERIKIEQKQSESDYKFHSSLRLLKNPLEQIDFEQVPVGVRLDPYSCAVPVLYFSLMKDKENFEILDELHVPTCLEIDRLRKELMENLKHIKQAGNEKRKKICGKLHYGFAYDLHLSAYHSIRKEILGHDKSHSDDVNAPELKYTSIKI